MNGFPNSRFQLFLNYERYLVKFASPSTLTKGTGEIANSAINFFFSGLANRASAPLHAYNFLESTIIEIIDFFVY
jgi:hypothetical protein